MSRPSRQVEVDPQAMRNLDDYITPRCAQFGLTAQQARTVVRAAHGMTNKMIGSDMFIEENTVKTHLARATVALKAKDRTHLVHLAWTLGLIVREPVTLSPLPIAASEYAGRLSPADVLAEALIRLHDSALDNSARFDQDSTRGFLRQAQTALAAAGRPLSVCVHCGLTNDHRVAA